MLTQQPLHFSDTRMHFQNNTVIMYRRDTGMPLLVLPRQCALDAQGYVRHDAHAGMFAAYADEFDKQFLADMHKMAEEYRKKTNHE